MRETSDMKIETVSAEGFPEKKTPIEMYLEYKKLYRKVGNSRPTPYESEDLAYLRNALMGFGVVFGNDGKVKLEECPSNFQSAVEEEEQD